MLPLKDYGLIYLALILNIFTCNPEKMGTPVKSSYENRSAHDLSAIRQSGRLIALVDNSSTSYFIYKGEPMGFEYELLLRFARYLNLQLDITVVKNMDSIIDYLNSGKGDIIAANYTVTSERIRKVNFTEPVLMTRQVLVQRKPDGWEGMKQDDIDDHLVRKQIDLAGKEIYVRMNSSFYPRLVSLSDEIGSPVKIITVPGEYETELLIKMVALGEIPYTVADENIARVNATYYPQLDVGTYISFPQKIAWAVRKSSPDLLMTINQWLLLEQKSPVFRHLCDRYFKDPKRLEERSESPYFSPLAGRISPYDHIARIYSRDIGWDWRLLVSIMYQESRFDHTARSWAGAFGVMQLMPTTARMFGADSFSTAAQHVSAGTRYLAWLEDHWKNIITDSVERLKFVLASYNVGLGHVIDSRNLAIKYNMDPNAWDGNVAECILMKSEPKYFNDSAVKYGYCRGEEPYNYVREVLIRYERYRQIVINS